MKWSNFGPAAEWKTKVFTRFDTWEAHCQLKGKQVHRLFLPRARGGLGLPITAHVKDVLHCCCLGVSGHVLGNTMFLLCYEGRVP
eukprot:3833287-Alexandrium_andersonii.AAC.1